MRERFETFTVLVANINRSIYKIKAEEMACFDLKSSHVSCLYYIYKADSLTAKGLCDVCGEDKANVSRAVRFLEERGYLVCNAKTQKRYQTPLELTERGKEVGKYIADKVGSILQYASAGLSEEHRTIMYESLKLINGNLNRLCEGYEGAEKGNKEI